MNILGNEDTHKKNVSQFIGRDSDHVFAKPDVYLLNISQKRYFLSQCAQYARNA
jgi:hypothetical protein